VFDSIRDGFSEAFRRLRGTAKFTEANMREGLASVRRALLEADVNIKVAETFIERVEEAAIGKDVFKALNPSEQIVGIVYEELVKLMGPVDPAIRLVHGRPTVLMMCGLQGSGKTTTTGKLANLLKKSGQHPLMVAADLQRPAAVEQLKTLGEQLEIPVYSEATKDPVAVCRNAVAKAKDLKCNVVLLDTAGRLHIDDALMRELAEIDKKAKPDQCLLVVDALTGQDAVNSAKAFNDALGLDAVILTKLDGDSRGGAALSIKEVTGVQIKFAGMGEKLDQLEVFRPEGMASRILGGGDMGALISKVSEVTSEEQARANQKKLEEGKFDLTDFRDQLRSMNKLGSMRKFLDLLPGGFGKMLPQDADPDAEVRRVASMIDSMTPRERSNPNVIDASRRRRIARGAGVVPHEINKLLKQFDDMRKVMQSMAKKDLPSRMQALMQMQRSGALTGEAPLRQKQRSERAKLTGKDLAKARKAERQRKKQNRKRGR
jgi:signal recognition particle subunit SRP54